MSEFNSRNRSRRFSPSSSTRRKINFDQLKPRQYDGDNDLTSDLTESSAQSSSRRNEDLSAVEDKLFGRPQRRSSNELESLLEGDRNEESKLQELSIAARLRALINSRTFESLPSRRKSEIREYVTNALNALESGQAEYPQFTKGVLNNIFVDDQIAKSSDLKDNIQCKSSANPKALESLKLFIDELQKSDIGRDCSEGISLNEIFKRDKPLFSDELLLLMIDNAMKRLKEKQNEVPLFSEDEAKIIIREELRKRNYFTTNTGEIIPGNNYPLTVDDLLNSQFNFESNKGFLLNLARFIANERLPEEGERTSLAKFLSDERGGVDGFDGGDVDLDKFSTSDLLKLRGAEYARLIESQNTTKGEASGTIRFLLDKIRREYETEDLDIFRQSIDNVEKLYTMIVQKTIEKYLDNESIKTNDRGFSYQALNYISQILLPVYLEIQILDSFEAKQRYYRQFYKLTDDKINEIIQFFSDRKTSTKKELFNSIISMFVRVMSNGIGPLENQLNAAMAEYKKVVNIKQINEVIVNMTIFNQSNTSDGRMLIFLSNERLFFSPDLLKFKKNSDLINVDTLIKMFSPDDYTSRAYKTIIGAVSIPVPGRGGAAVAVVPPIPVTSPTASTTLVTPTGGLLFGGSEIIPFTAPTATPGAAAAGVNNVGLVIQDHPGSPIQELNVDFRQIVLLSVMLNVAECIAKFYSDKVYSPDYAKIIKRLFHKVKLELDSEEDIIVVSVLEKLNTLFNVMYHERAIPYAKIINKCFNRVDIRTSEFGGNQLNNGFVIDTARMLLKEAIINIPTAYDDSEDQPTNAAESTRRVEGFIRTIYLTFVQTNNLLNDVDKTLRSVYPEVFNDKKTLTEESFNLKVNFALTFKLYCEALFFISTKLLRFYITGGVNFLVSEATIPGVISMTRATAATIFTNGADIIFRTNNIVNKATALTAYVNSLYNKLINNDSYIKSTIEYFKKLSTSKKLNGDQMNIVTELLDDFKELKYDKIYYDIGYTYINNTAVDGNLVNGFKNVMSRISRLTTPPIATAITNITANNGNIGANPGGGAARIPPVDNITYQYLTFLSENNPAGPPAAPGAPFGVFAGVDSLLSLDINPAATQDDVNKAINLLNILIRNLQIASQYLPNIGNQAERQIMTNVNSYLLVLAHMAKNILHIRYFYHRLAV